jgi:hypothetical protein
MIGTSTLSHIERSQSIATSAKATASNRLGDYSQLLTEPNLGRFRRQSRMPCHKVLKALDLWRRFHRAGVVVSLSIPVGEGGCRSDEGREVKEAVGRLMPRTARRIQDREWVGVLERATRDSRDRTEARPTAMRRARTTSLCSKGCTKYSFDYVGGYVQSASLSQHLLEPACFIAIVRIF